MKDIPGFEGRYAITSCGRVWSYLTNKELKQVIMPNGYHRVVLRGTDKKSHACLVHRLVGLAYLSNPENKPEIDHLDHNRNNNNVNNLRWATHKENSEFLVGTHQTEEHKRKRVESRRTNNGGKW